MNSCARRQRQHKVPCASVSTLTYRAEDAKDGNPQDEEDEAPGRGDDARLAQDKGDEVDDARHGRHCADDDGVHLRPVSITGRLL